MGRNELNAAFGRGKDDGWISSQAGGCCETQDARAGIGMVDSGEQTTGRRYRGKQEIEFAKELLMLVTESSVTVAESLDFGFTERRAPVQTSGDGGIEFVEKAGVELRGFVGLERRVDVPCFGPERRIESFDWGASNAANALLPDVQGMAHIGLAGFDERSGENTDANCGPRGILRR